ncbi:MAG: hypothetical protein VYE40_09680 [Myxococcota bacterium]|nr:hypothetical protein [Myxococcota bacterium]
MMTTTVARNQPAFQGGVGDVGQTAATLLDKLVRSSRNQRERLDLPAQRLHALWCQSHDFEIQVAPEQLLVDGEVVFEAHKELGDWILAAFMAGVRSIRMDINACADDFMLLAVELGALEINANSMLRFRDWLWSDGSEGLIIKLQRSFVEVIESMDVVVDVKATGRGRARELLPARFGGAFSVSNEDLERVAKRPELHAPLDIYTQGVQYRGFEMSPEERAMLRSSCMDSERWALVELEAALSNADIRTSLHPERLARRLLDYLLKTSSATLLSKVCDLYRRKDDGFSSAVIACLERSQYISRLVLELELEDAVLVELSELFQVLGVAQQESFASSMLHRLLEDGSEENLRRFARLLRRIDMNTFRERAQERLLGTKAAMTHAELLLYAGISPKAFSEVLGVLDDVATGRLLASLPDAFMIEAEVRLRDLLEDGPRAVVEDLAMYLLSRNQVGYVHILAGAMLKVRETPWSRKTVRHVCEAIMLHQLEEEYLVPPIRDRRASLPYREIALELLLERGSDDLVARATKWRLSEYFDQPAFRERLKTGRERLGHKRDEKTVNDGEFLEESGS